MQSLSTAQARRIALAAQGFLDRRHATPTMRTFQRTLDRTGVLQVDSVNVLQRAHYMPLYSRMGAYDVDLLRRAAERRPRRMVEYWAHVQALHAGRPVAGDAAPDGRVPRRTRQVAASRSTPSSRLACLAEVRERGASTARDLDDGLPRAKEHWGWNWSETRKVLDYLYIVGRPGHRRPQQPVRGAATTCRSGCSRRRCSSAPTPTLADANRELVRRAARSHGVATAPVPARLLPDARDRDVRRRRSRSWSRRASWCRSRIEGWSRPAYLHRDARLPRRVRRRALLSPFDPVVWERRAGRAALRLPLPDRDLHPGAQARPRLLRAAVPARRPDRRPGRPEGRPAGRPLLVKAAYAEPRRARRDRRGARGRAARPRRLAGARPPSRSSRAATWRRLLTLASEPAC